MENSMSTKVSIVAPIHNRRDITLQCLKSLERINKDQIEVDVYIVDDGSTDGSSAAIREFYPQVNIIEGNGDLWYTEGTNVGIRKALEGKADYILAINDDSVFDHEFLNFLVQTARQHPKSVVGPLLLLWNEPHKLFQTAPIWSTFAGGWKHWQKQTVWTVPSDPWEVDLIVGNCVLYPASAFQNCGLMDSKRFPNFGDAEYTPRLKRAGYKLIIDPRSRVFCQPNAMPERLRNRSLTALMRDLFVDLKQPANLTRLFLSNVLGGPSAWEGALAFMVLIAKTGFRAFRTGTLQATHRHEPPLSEVFSAYVLEQK